MIVQGSSAIDILRDNSVFDDVTVAVASCVSRKRRHAVGREVIGDATAGPIYRKGVAIFISEIIYLTRRKRGR